MPRPSPSPRRALIGVAALGLALTCTSLPSAGVSTAAPDTGAAAGSSAPRPNLMLITVDDMSLKDLAHLPNIQRLLVDQGTTAVNGLAPTPLCVPARASLLSGQYAHNHRALHIGRRNAGFRSFADHDTLPVWLQDAGYRTGFVGKYLNGYGSRPLHGKPGWRYVPPGWDTWRGSIDMKTYNYSRTVLSANGTRQIRAAQYNTDGFAQQADSFIAQHRTGKPWYLWVNYVAPHKGGPHDQDDPRRDVRTYASPSPARKYRNRYRAIPRLSTPEMFETDTSDKVVRAARKRWKPSHQAKIAGVRQQRLEALRSVDDAVARHVAVLRRTGQLDRTVIAFTSDNGFQVGEHNLVGKLWHYKNSSGVPMVFRGPGIAAGHRTRTIIANPDIPVTLAALAGATPQGRVVDGIDVSGALRGTETVRAVPTAAWAPKGSQRPMFRGVRVGERWNYVRMRSGAEELYDWARDPYELSNVATDPRYAEVRNELRDLTTELASCSGHSPDLATSCQEASVTERARTLARASIG